MIKPLLLAFLLCKLSWIEISWSFSSFKLFTQTKGFTCLEASGSANTGSGCWDITLSTPGLAQGVLNAKYCKVKRELFK